MAIDLDKLERDALEQEIEAYSGFLATALRETHAGNERMRNFAESYATHLDGLYRKLNALQEVSSNDR